MFDHAGFAVATAVLGALALYAPVAAEAPIGWIGMLLVLGAIVEVLHGFRRSSLAASRSAWTSGAITLLMGVVLLNAPLLASHAIRWIFAAGFAIDGLRYLRQFARARQERARASFDLLAGMANLAVGAALVLLHGPLLEWVVAIAVGLRLLGVAWTILLEPVYETSQAHITLIDTLGLPRSLRLDAIGARLEQDEAARARFDRATIITFVVTLFAIHLGRMGFDRSSLFGLLSPIAATLGDMAMAVLIAFLLVIPSRLLLLKLTRPLEHRVWMRVLAEPAPASRSCPLRLGERWVTGRMLFALRLRQARYSIRVALRHALHMGLPLATILAATIPVAGMSWYFDTENWTAGIWDSVAAQRTDTWREAMSNAVSAQALAAGRAADFAIQPPGVKSGEDFSFIVIGDPGEGDASQYVLHDRLVSVAGQVDVRLVLVSSDVVYPTGAMRDYEKNFWSPFKGIDKPVYAIPGNHDWYDSLDAFAATFFAPDAARAAIHARIEADHNLSTTSTADVKGIIAQATALRGHYGVPTGFQQGPFFQIQTDRFALIAIDTGVRRRVDPSQLAWLKRSLGAARGKFIMAVLGHPLYAMGEYVATEKPNFAQIHQMLREAGATIVMGGDTHDLEYYAEPVAGSAEPWVQHHFVNGGGGAYLSIGTVFASPERMPTRDWAFYPARAPLIAKIDAQTPQLMAPFWWWTKRTDGWPFNAEFLSAAFDYNAAPFYQSFVEVRVEPSSGHVRVWPHGVRGRLRWSEIETSPGLRPAGASPDDFIEWSVPLANPLVPS